MERALLLDMGLPGLGFIDSKVSARARGRSVSGNWRVIFTFVGKDADSVDYEDYH